MFERQPNILDFTPGTGQTEWNLAHHLAVELREFFPSLDYDLEIVKVNYEKRRPDIVFHRRGTHEANHLVIEIKRDGSAAEVADDIHKIESNWFRAPLHYEYGAMINLRSDGKHEIQVLTNRT